MGSPTIYHQIINAFHIHCNKCGKNFDIWDYNESYSINTVAGYGSEHDGEKIEKDTRVRIIERESIIVTVEKITNN